MNSYPYIIENGHGEQLTFLGVTRALAGDRVEWEGVAQPGRAMLEVPTIVRRLLLPIAYIIGRALGKFEKYGDAPAPIERKESVSANAA